MKATLVLSGQDLPSSGSEDQGALEARKSSGHGESSGEKAEKRRYRERPCSSEVYWSSLLKPFQRGEHAIIGQQHSLFPMRLLTNSSTATGILHPRPSNTRVLISIGLPIMYDRQATSARCRQTIVNNRTDGSLPCEQIIPDGLFDD
jgi:hypothetical protein